MKSLSVRLRIILIGLAIFGNAEVCKAESAWVPLLFYETWTNPPIGYSKSPHPP
jgi:hypothetical protein